MTRERIRDKWSVIIFVIIFALCISAVRANAQSLNYGSNIGSVMTEDAVQGIINVTSSIISDSFTPMTHYNKEDWSITFVPAYFKVNKLFDDRSLQGDNLKGFALGFGGGYALNDRLLAYGILTHLDIDGKAYSRELPDYVTDTKYSLSTLTAGLGFDIIEHKKWSIPLYLGVCLQRYNAEIIPPPFSYTLSSPFPSQTVAVQVDVTGSGMIYGLTAAIAVSRDFFDLLRVTPYFLFLRSMNKPELIAESKAQVSILGQVTGEYTLNISNINGSMIGLNLTLLSSDALSFSISAGGLISSGSSYYNEKFLDGLEMMSIVLAVSYSGNTSETGENK